MRAKVFATPPLHIMQHFALRVRHILSLRHILKHTASGPYSIIEEFKAPRPADIKTPIGNINSKMSLVLVPPSSDLDLEATNYS